MPLTQTRGIELRPIWGRVGRDVTGCVRLYAPTLGMAMKHSTDRPTDHHHHSCTNHGTSENASPRIPSRWRGEQFWHRHKLWWVITFFYNICRICYNNFKFYWQCYIISLNKIINVLNLILLLRKQFFHY